MDEIHKVVTECYKEFETKLKKECEKRNWELKFSKHKIKSIDGKDGRLFDGTFSGDEIELDYGNSQWTMRLDFGWSEWHDAPRSDENDKYYESQFYGAFVNSETGEEFPFEFNNEFYLSHACGEWEDYAYRFDMENKPNETEKFWDVVREAIHHYIIYNYFWLSV